MWIATNCFNGFNRRNGNLKFVENDGVLGFAAMLQFVCVDWFGLARSSRKATPFVVPKQFVYAQFGPLLAKPHVFGAQYILFADRM